MMLGRGGTARDREIIRARLGVLVRKGPRGWWRIVKNAVRSLARAQERPISVAAWARPCGNAGFAPVATFAIVAKAGLVTTRRPDKNAWQPAERRAAPRVARR
jgi:hypothetical protein